jgi:Apea-like HEPN
MLEIHEGLKARLIASLTEGLKLVEVRHGKFLPTESRMALLSSDESLPTHGPLRDKLNSYVDTDFPLMMFVCDSLQNELLVHDYNDDVPLQKLTEIAAYNDTVAQANRLVSDFQSLPWQYSLSIRLRHDVSVLLSETIVDEQLAPNIRLVKVTPPFAEKYPLNHADEKRQIKIHGGGSLLYPAPDKVSWTDNVICLQIETEGFIGPYGGSGPATQAERILKAFLGLGIALGLFKVGDVHSTNPPSYSFYVHKAHADTWCIDSKIDLDTETSRVWGAIQLSEMFSGQSKEKKRQLVALILAEMKAVFSAGTNAEAIVLGAEWLLESYSGRDSRLRYVQSMVVLEVLLGDKATADEIGLGQLLRNRCAYLIGKNQHERRTLLKEFDEIYAVRSQIVHRGKAQLSFKERLLFNKLRDICNRVIQREVDLLRAK